MNNTIEASITASLNFDFRGQRFSPSIRVDLHAMMIKQQHVQHLYDMLAASIGLDAYRHEYDVMVLHDITFSEPDGLACDFVNEGKLDFDGFVEAWQQQRALHMVQPIARKHLDITDLNQHPDIKHALIDSYIAGQSTGNPSTDHFRKY